MGSNQSTKTRTMIGVIVLLAANSSAGGAEWCTSALADIAARFPDVPYSIITLVNNIPNLCAVVFMVIAGILVNRRVTLKHMLLFGIGCHCIGGVLPAIFGNTSIAMVFIGRCAFGVGYGLMQGIGVSMGFKLVADEGLRQHAMGWAVTAQYAMNMIAQVVVGHLCAMQWNYSFYIYAWSAVSFLIVLILCPDFPLVAAFFTADTSAEIASLRPFSFAFMAAIISLCNVLIFMYLFLLNYNKRRTVIISRYVALS